MNRFKDHLERLWNRSLSWMEQATLDGQTGSDSACQGREAPTEEGSLGVPNPCFGAVYCCLVMPNETRVLHSDPEILGGTPVFVGTRVPVKSLFDYLEAGDSLDEFLESFPSVTREQAVAALELARSMTEAHATAAR